MPTRELDPPRLGRKRMSEDVRFVDRRAFLELLVSTRRLERRDDARAGLRGLHDPVNGVTFYIQARYVQAESIHPGTGLAAPRARP